MPNLTVNTYDSATSALTQEGATGLSFGNVAAGNHATTVNVIKPIPDELITLSAVNLYLEDKGMFTKSNFGYFKSSSFISGISAGSDYLSDHFTEMPDVSTVTTGGLELTAGDPEFVWLDLDVQEAKYGNGSINYRFVYEFT